MRQYSAVRRGSFTPPCVYQFLREVCAFSDLPVKSPGLPNSRERFSGTVCWDRLLPSFSGRRPGATSAGGFLPRTLLAIPPNRVKPKTCACVGCLTPSREGSTHR